MVILPRPLKLFRSQQCGDQIDGESDGDDEADDGNDHGEPQRRWRLRA
jgi:hypothetical protein